MPAPWWYPYSVLNADVFCSARRRSRRCSAVRCCRAMNSRASSIGLSVCALGSHLGRAAMAAASLGLPPTTTSFHRRKSASAASVDSSASARCLWHQCTL